MEAKKYSLSVVVPLFNEEGNVLELHRRIQGALDQIGSPYEILFVDDGSRDQTRSEVLSCTPVTLIVFRKNYGQTAAFDAGIKAATGDIIITLDGDLQNDPADIPLLLEKIMAGYDVVSGWRYRRRDPWSKTIPSRIANMLRKILIHDDIHDSGCSLKAYRRECFQDIDLFGEMHRFIPAILQLEGYRVTEVKVSHHPRLRGVTKYNWKRGMKGFVDMLAIWFWRKYSNRPLHLFGGVGVVLFAIGSGILAWMLIDKLVFGASLSERVWPLMGIFFTLAGTQFFISGLLADISVKSYYQARHRMNYNIREVITNK